MNHLTRNEGRCEYDYQYIYEVYSQVIEIMEGIAGIILGISLILYRKKFAKFVMRYHQKRTGHKLKEYPKVAWITSNRLVQVYAAMIGIGFTIFGILFLVSSSSTRYDVNIIHHSEDMAAQKAVDFAEVAFIRRDYESAYSFLSKRFRNNISFENFKSSVIENHLRGFPTLIKAVAYEPIPGQKMMNILLYGESENKKYYYRFTMEGTKEINYKVSNIHQSDKPYPSSELKLHLKKNFLRTI